MSSHDNASQPAESVLVRVGTVPQAELQETIKRIAEPILRSLRLALVDVELRGRESQPLIRLVIERLVSDSEREEMITLDDCERAHMLIGHALDVEDPIPNAYVLEVSSPGLDRPIRRPDEYERFRGRLARFKLMTPVNGQRVVIGRIQKLEENCVWVEISEAAGRQGKAGHGKKEGQVARSLALPLEQIREARLEVEL